MTQELINQLSKVLDPEAWNWNNRNDYNSYDKNNRRINSKVKAQEIISKHVIPNTYHRSQEELLQAGMEAFEKIEAAITKRLGWIKAREEQNDSLLATAKNIVILLDSHKPSKFTDELLDYYINEANLVINRR